VRSPETPVTALSAPRRTRAASVRLAAVLAPLLSSFVLLVAGAGPSAADSFVPGPDPDPEAVVEVPSPTGSDAPTATPDGTRVGASGSTPVGTPEAPALRTSTLRAEPAGPATGALMVLVAVVAGAVLFLAGVLTGDVLAARAIDGTRALGSRRPGSRGPGSREQRSFALGRAGGLSRWRSGARASR